MKSLFALLAIVMAVSCGPVSAEDHIHEADDFDEIKKQAVVKCSKEHTITEDAIKDIMNHIQVAEDEEVKCWISCVLETMGILTNKSIDWARLGEILASGVPSEDEAKVHQIVQICRDIVDDDDDEDECHIAYSLADCKIKNWNQFGLPKGNWEK